jgi:hypothetical protein
VERCVVSLSFWKPPELHSVLSACPGYERALFEGPISGEVCLHKSLLLFIRHRPNKLLQRHCSVCRLSILVAIVRVALPGGNAPPSLPSWIIKLHHNNCLCIATSVCLPLQLTATVLSQYHCYSRCGSFVIITRDERQTFAVRLCWCYSIISHFDLFSTTNCFRAYSVRIEEWKCREAPPELLFFDLLIYVQTKEVGISQILVIQHVHKW